MSTDNNETKRINTSKIKKQKNKIKNSEKGKKIKFKDKHPKLSLAIKITILILILLVIIGAGILVGAFVGIFGDELKIDEASLVVGDENSTVYDADGQLIATLSGGTKRKSIKLSEMSEYLPKAYVAIEDERFYKHSGIDIMRTAYATFNYAIHFGKSSFGGSTITQQVIKNITQEKDKTALAGIMRKVKEISKAIQVEHYLSKDQILELYLNLIFVGGDDINGVELGSIYYFNKSAKDLDIAECAYLAGINHSPNYYRPFDNFEGKENSEQKKQEMTDRIKKRTKTVLEKMKELEYINDEQYKTAISEVDTGLHFQKGESASVTTELSYVTDAAINQILDQMTKNSDMKRDVAEMYLYSGGLKIYTTQKTDIQNLLEQEIVKKDWYGKKGTYKKEGKEIEQYSTPTMVIEDYRTGQIVAAATATGSPEERTATTKRGFLNFPTQINKQTGSSMKPISVIAPGLKTGVITGATVYYNQLSTWGSGADEWKPKNSTGYSDYINIRTAIEWSANIPHAKALTDIGIEASVEFCKSVGLPDFTDEGLSLALGGLSNGISPTKLLAAYSAIANDGVYKTPTFYTKVTDSAGNVLYEPEQEEKEVLSKQLAFIEKDILKQPVIGTSKPTASYCKIPGIDVAAKTGTTNDDFDRWLCGFTPYYSATCWYGYEYNYQVSGFGKSNPAGKIWDAVMTEIHKDLPNATFTEPEGIIKKEVCTFSGKLATDACAGSTYTELFTEENVPTESCEGHGQIAICNDTKLIATPFCPNQTPISGYVPEKERNPKWVTEGKTTNIPEGTCTLHVAPVEEHVHNYTEILSQTDATCTTAGTRTKKCSCGATVNETIPIKGHVWSAWQTTQQPTTVAEGVKTRTCTVCGKKETENIPKEQEKTENKVDDHGGSSGPGGTGNDKDKDTNTTSGETDNPGTNTTGQ